MNKEPYILRAYQEQGKSRKTISKEVGLHITTITNILTRHGVKIRPQYSSINENGDLIIKLYKEGKNCTEISNVVGCSRWSVSNFLKKNGVKVKSAKEVLKTPAEDNSHKILQLYEEGKTCTEIGQIIGCNHKSVTKLLRKNGIKVKSSAQIQRKTPDGDELVRLHVDEKKSCKEIAKIHGISYQQLSRHLKSEGVNIRRMPTSTFELEVRGYLSELSIDYECNNMQILGSGRELDLYIPSHNLSIECNGYYWHHAGIKAKTYHQDKTKECKDAGIRLIHLWDYEWETQKSKLKQYLNALLTPARVLYARKAKIIKVDVQTQRLFLERYHLQGYIPSTLMYGLYYNEQCIMVMGMIKRSDSTYEITRLCTKSGYVVTGGANRLYQHLCKSLEPKKVISYCDLDKFTGDVYKNLGMEKTGTSVGYCYVKTHTDILSRQQCQKHKLVQQGYDPSMTEYEIMKSRGYLRIYNSGVDKWVSD